MEWTLELIAAIVAVNLVRVASKSFQQLSVCFDCYWLVPFGSVVMSACEVAVWSGAAFVVVSGDTMDLVTYAAILAGSGAAGSMGAMRLHKRVRAS